MWRSRWHKHQYKCIEQNEWVTLFVNIPHFSRDLLALAPLAAALASQST
jgi:hypothetical protein